MTNLFPTNEELQVMMQEIFDLHLNEGSALLTSIDLLGRLHQGHAEARLRLSPETFAQTIGLTVDKYFKRLQVHRTMRIFPEMRQLPESGATGTSPACPRSPGRRWAGSNHGTCDRRSGQRLADPQRPSSQSATGRGTPIGCGGSGTNGFGFPIVAPMPGLYCEGS